MLPHIATNYVTPFKLCYPILRQIETLIFQVIIIFPLCKSVPLLFVSRQFVSLLLVFNNSSPLLFVFTQFVSLLFVSKNSSPLLFVSTTFRLQTIRLLTIRLHYYSFPLLFVSTTFRLQQFVSTTIRVNYKSIIYSLVDVINNTGKNSYGGSFVRK